MRKECDKRYTHQSHSISNYSGNPLYCNGVLKETEKQHQELADALRLSVNTSWEHLIMEVEKLTELCIDQLLIEPRYSKED